MRLDRFQARAGRFAFQAHRHVAGRFVKMATVLWLCRKLRPDQWRELKRLVDSLAGQEHVVRRLDEVRAILRFLVAAARRTSRGTRLAERMRAERAARLTADRVRRDREAEIQALLDHDLDDDSSGSWGNVVFVDPAELLGYRQEAWSYS